LGEVANRGLGDDSSTLVIIVPIISSWNKGNKIGHT